MPYRLSWGLRRDGVGQYVEGPSVYLHLVNILPGYLGGLYFRVVVAIIPDQCDVLGSRCIFALGDCLWQVSPRARESLPKRRAFEAIMNCYAQV